MTRVNYVLAAYTGPRASEDPRQQHDRAWFVKQHLERLSQLEHTLDQITIVLARGGNEGADAEIAAMHGQGDLEPCVLVRENSSFSYGSWEHAFLEFGDRFSHYIFIEDDYLPCHNHFDRALVGVSDAKQTHVCSLTAWENTHAAISNSICTFEMLDAVMPALSAEEPPDRPHRESGFHAQLMWSWHFYTKGYEVLDWTDSYASPFWNGHEVRWYGHPKRPCMLAPVHAIGRPVSFADGVQSRFAGTMAPDGSVTPSSAADLDIWNEWLSRGDDDSRWRFPRLLSKPAWWAKKGTR